MQKLLLVLLKDTNVFVWNSIKDNSTKDKLALLDPLLCDVGGCGLPEMGAQPGDEGGHAIYHKQCLPLKCLMLNTLFGASLKDTQSHSRSGHRSVEILMSC